MQSILEQNDYLYRNWNKVNSLTNLLCFLVNMVLAFCSHFLLSHFF